MRDFSLDLQSENIHSAKTREYFDEVIKAYYSESYRSATVMLYSIAVADLIYKVEELKDIYNDTSAIEIINSITDLQTRNPNSPDWESKLIELVKEKTNLLEPADYLHLVTLQKHRHLCAHPVLTQNFELYNPNRETTRAHIRNILEGLLIKPALLSRKIFNDFVKNLSSIKNTIRNDDQIEKHLKAKYLNKFNQKVSKSIFRSLWKVTFKTKDKDCDENREINLKALIVFLKNEYSFLVEEIKKEADYFSEIDTDNLWYAIILFNHFPGIFALQNESLRILARNIIEKEADLVTLAIFLSNNITDHIEKVLSINWNSDYEDTYISLESILAVFNYALINNNRDLAFDFIIKMFGNSNQFEIADNRFDNLINPYLNEFNKKELKLLVKTINSNSQIYSRRKASSSNYLVKQRVLEVYGDKFDFSLYTHFK